MNQVLNSILMSHGFKILESSIKERKVIGTKETSKIYIGYILAKDEPLDLISNHKIRSEMENCTKTIVVCLPPVTTSIKRVCDEYGFELWDHKRFITELGRAVYRLIDLEGEGDDKTQGKNLFELAFDVTQSADRDTIDNVLHGIVKTDKDVGESIKVIRPNFGLDDVKQLVQESIGVYECKLQLVPIYLFDYRCMVIGEGSGEIIETHGTIGINAITGSSLVFSKNPDLIDYLDWDYTVIEPRLSVEDAENYVRDCVVKINTRDVERIEESETSTIIERVSYRPKDDSIEVHNKGTIYLPLWGIAGKEGIMLINATNGEVIKEDTFYKKG